MYKDRRAFFKSEARAVLRRNYPSLVASFALVLLCSAGVSLVKRSMLDFFDTTLNNAIIAAQLFFDLAGLLVIIPLCAGILRSACALYLGENEGGRFAYFLSSAEGILGCCRVFAALLLRVVIAAVPYCVFAYAVKAARGPIERLFIDNTGGLVTAGFALILVLLTIPALLYFMRYTAVPFLFVRSPERTTKELIKHSSALMEGHLVEAFVFNLSFLGWLLLCRYTAGILSVMYVLPYYTLSYVSFMTYLEGQRQIPGAKIKQGVEYSSDEVYNDIIW